LRRGLPKWLHVDGKTGRQVAVPAVDLPTTAGKPFTLAMLAFLLLKAVRNEVAHKSLANVPSKDDANVMLAMLYVFGNHSTVLCGSMSLALRQSVTELSSSGFSARDSEWPALISVCREWLDGLRATPVLRPSAAMMCSLSNVGTLVLMCCPRLSGCTWKGAGTASDYCRCDCSGIVRTPPLFTVRSAV
jgi:hypothetical protein